MGDETSGRHSLGDNNISIILVGVGSAALVVTIYHCFAVSWCGHHQPSSSTPPRRTFPTQIVEMPISIENSVAQLIPTHKYKKATSLEGDDGMCSVCLCDFEEGEEIRTLPVCLHSYHAPCIDMWLYSHSNCPMCRTDAAPSSQIFQPAVPDLGSQDLESGMLQNTFIQSTSRTLM